jgi:hypothetical protein
LAETAAVLARWVKDVDTTRPVTSGVVVPSVSRLSGYTDVLDVVGYNYKDKYYEVDHKLYPYQPIIGSENVGQLFEWTAVAEARNAAQQAASQTNGALDARIVAGAMHAASIRDAAKTAAITTATADGQVFPQPPVGNDPGNVTG